MRPDFVLSRALQIRRQKDTSKTPFLLNSSQWLLLNVSYLFRKAKRKTVFIPLLCLIQLKSCNCIKIEKQKKKIELIKPLHRLHFLSFAGQFNTARHIYNKCVLNSRINDHSYIFFILYFQRKKSSPCII